MTYLFVTCTRKPAHCKLTKSLTHWHREGWILINPLLPPQEVLDVNMTNSSRIIIHHMPQKRKLHQRRSGGVALGFVEILWPFVYHTPQREQDARVLISPTANILPSPQDSPHIISYAFHFDLLFINAVRPTPYCFSAVLWLTEKMKNIKD